VIGPGPHAATSEDGRTPRPERWRAVRGDALWALLVVALALGAFFPVLTGARTLLYRDVARLYAPVRTLVVEALREGRLPLWNPHVGTGKPLFAEGVHGVLHPVSLLAAVVAPESVDFLLLAYVACAALGAGVLARALGASRAAGAAAGSAYGLAGYTLSMTGNLVFLAGAASLPWIAAALRACGEGRRAGVPLAAVAVAAGIFSGDVQVAGVGIAIGVALAAGAGGWKVMGRCAVAVLVGALLAGVHVAAAVQELRSTYRGVALSEPDRLRWALSPWRLVELVAPGFFRGDLTRDTAPVFAALDPTSAWIDPPVPFAESVFVGASVVALAALAGRDRSARLLAAGAGVLLWLALGHHAGSRQLLGSVPVWSSFRYTEKLVAPLTLCLATLAALGLDRVAREGLPRRARRAIFAGAAVAVGVSAACALAPGAVAAIFPIERAPDPAAWPGVALLGRGLVQAALALGLLLAAASAGSPRLRPLLLVAAVAAPAIAAARHAVYFADPELEAVVPPFLRASAPGPRVARTSEFVYVPEGVPDEIHVVNAADRRSAAPCANVAARLDTIDDYSGFLSRRLLNLEGSFGAEFPVLARRYAATHVAVVGRVGSPELAWRAAPAIEGGRRVFWDRATQLEFFEVPHRPWAFFARRALAADHPATARDRLRELPRAGEDGAVVVEASTAPATAPGRVLAVERRAERVRIEAEADGDALLVVNDAFWPGWKATLDGREVPILAADVLVRAVRWPSGRHVLEMHYAPREVTLGLGLSALGVALLAAALFRAAWRDRRARAAGAR
jgi:hypothetical protein